MPSYAYEKTAQTLVTELGHEIRTNDRTLPGSPDIFIPEKCLVVQVFGCFFHRHLDCPYCRTPARHIEHWAQKFKRTQDRDQHSKKALLQRGFRLLILWTCALDYGLADRLRPALAAFIQGDEFYKEIGRLDLLALARPTPDLGSAAE